jgi:hypothetical protein
MRCVLDLLLDLLVLIGGVAHDHIEQIVRQIVYRFGGVRLVLL